MLKTYEDILSDYSTIASVVPYRNWIIVATPTYKGIQVFIYETVHFSEGLSIDEAGYYRIFEDSDGVFEDQGRALQWAMKEVDSIA